MPIKTLGAAEGETLAAVAYKRLRTDIIEGKRPPGERLRIEKLKSIYNIGPTPLREAMQKLAQEGLVFSEGNRGFTVAPLNLSEFQDLNLARTVVEQGALKLSIENGDTTWEARVVAAAYIMSKEDVALAAAGDTLPQSWELANTEFHTALVSACGSDWLLKIRTNLHDLCERYRRASVYQKAGARDLRAEHAAIADATLARDIDRACALIADHFARTASALSSESEITAPEDRHRA